MVIHMGWINVLPNSKQCCSFLRKYAALPKNGLYHYLYAFEISTKITLKIFSQKISPHKNQIGCSTLEQSDFRTSITCFSFFFSIPFYFSLPFPYLFYFKFFLSFPNLISCLKPLWIKFYPLWDAPYIRYEGVLHNFPKGTNSWRPLILTC